ncbi:hypothetical protein ACJMK2_009826 [Sinanodonta woodiana]|uniref:Uncharacterized protein n=1 Tax=Sinanodonta woodiana TaxID=1069815 RepID=A0ABD3VGF4_SINWO
MALASVEHKRFLTPEEFISQHRKRFSQYPDEDFSIELESLECVLQRDRVSRSVRISETVTKSPRQSSIRNISFQNCRMDTRQHQPCNRKPRAPKGRSTRKSGSLEDYIRDSKSTVRKSISSRKISL